MSLTWIAIIAAVAWFFLTPSKEKQAPVLALPVAVPPVPVVQSASGHGASCLVSLRKQLASDEKLTPELKAAFDAISAALKDGGAA